MIQRMQMNNLWDAIAGIRKKHTTAVTQLRQEIEDEGEAIEIQMKKFVANRQGGVGGGGGESDGSIEQLKKDLEKFKERTKSSFDKVKAELQKRGTDGQ